MHSVKIKDFVGRFGIRQDEGRFVAGYLTTALAAGDDVTVDLSGMAIVTRMFCHGLLEAPMRSLGAGGFASRVRVTADDDKVRRMADGVVETVANLLENEASPDWDEVKRDLDADFAAWQADNPRTAPLDDKRLAEIEERALMADPDSRSYEGWEAGHVDGAWRIGMKGNLDTRHDAVLTVTGGMVDDNEAKAVAEFVAAAHTDVLDLVRELRAARAELTALRRS